MKVRVILAFSNRLISEGMGRLLEGDGPIEVVGALEAGEEYTREQIEALAPNIALTDFTTLYNCFPEFEEGARKFHYILVDTACGRDNLVSAILKKKISGVLLAKSDVAHLKKAIVAVSRGEIWLDKHTFKSLLHGINALSNEKTSLLSAREKEIVCLTGKGLRNKEIAQKLNISETTVKTHMNRIFQKLNIKARSELISYAIKNDDMSMPGP